MTGSWFDYEGALKFDYLDEISDREHCPISNEAWCFLSGHSLWYLLTVVLTSIV